MKAIDRTLLVSLALVVSGCGFGITYDSQSKCSVQDLGKWNATGLSQSNVQQPMCPVVVSINSSPTSYLINVIASDLTKLQGAAVALLSFFNTHNDVVPGGGQQNLIFGFNGNTAQLFGSYYAASYVGPTTGNDYGKVRLPLHAVGDSARSQAILMYKFHGASILSGPPTAPPSQSVTIFADASAEYRPITYQWWIDGASQGGAGSSSTLTTSFAAQGSHSVRAVVHANDGHVYDQTVYIDVQPCPGGQISC